MPPARRSKHGDGLFGYYGLRVTPKGWPAMLSLQASPSAISGRARFDVLLESRGRSALTLKLGAQTVLVRDGQVHDGQIQKAASDRGAGAPPLHEAPACSRAPGSSIEHVELEGQGTDTLTLEIQTGRPRLHGVIVESEQPGVVLDTVGIDGARIATALAWDEESFIAELAARRPDLIVLAFGTNEAFDALRVSAYDQELSSLLGRARRAAPDSECLVLGPPDALDVEGGSVARIPEIAGVYAQTAARLGCAFYSLQAAMGGPGSFAAWQRTEPRFAQADRIHLTKDGYRELGERLSAELLGALGF
ncbi:MAG TPA: GDSL-type esterase/lipase family protein [Polyangiaceae bacterium]|nr:GDSL-type esterase/lipase family protein [Polyangiaceae bacterium]